jgi:hypothetical protein
LAGAVGWRCWRLQMAAPAVLPVGRLA